MTREWGANFHITHSPRREPVETMPRRKWDDYVLRKREWEEAHPEATHEDHARAMQEIARELNV